MGVMRKRELVYVHHLLRLLRDDLERRGVADSTMFAEYDAASYHSRAVHKPKEYHERAIERLYEGFDRALGRSAVVA